MALPGRSSDPSVQQHSLNPASAPAPAPAPSTASSSPPELGQGVKRRKIRKGTRSCWDCKRRKVRCTFASPAEAVCIHCQRRGTRCLGQETEDEDTSTMVAGQRPQAEASGRTIRVETAVDMIWRDLVSTNGKGANATLLEPPVSHTSSKSTPRSRESESFEVVSLYEPPADETNLALDARDKSSPVRGSAPVPALLSQQKLETLSSALHAALPCREDLEILCKAGPHVSIHFDRVMRIAYSDLQTLEPSWVEKLLRVPNPKTHPVLLARYMFLIVTFLQYLDPMLVDQVKNLSEQPRDMMKRLANTAISLVTTNDDLLSTVESVETIMAEGIYHANSGDLRRAWVVFRRAMAVAQLMGMHRSTTNTMKLIDRDTKCDAKFLWSRIVYTDRLLCLMLGLPQGSMDRRMPRDSTLARDTPMGRLECLHSAISCRILERNDFDDGLGDLAAMREIDAELQAAARIMPSRWWRTPNLAAAAAETKNDPKAVFWDMLRLVTQLYHYNLLNQIHLPFMLRFDSTPTQHGHGYSQTMCVNASREVLSRFIEYRTFNQVASCCRAVDFFTMLAALTLTLAHLESHRRQRLGGSVDFLAHQHPGDRAMMEQALENMQVLARVNQDDLCFKNVKLLRRLLAIEAEAADGHGGDATEILTRPGRDHQGESDRSQSDRAGNDENVLRIRVPFLGIVQIGREGVTTKQQEQPDAHVAERPMSGRPTDQHDIPRSYSGPSTSMTVDDSNPDDFAAEPVRSTVHVQAQNGQNSADSRGEETADGLEQENAWNFTSQPVELIGDMSQQFDLDSEMLAGVEDWAFQGANTAFLGNFM